MSQQPIDGHGGNLDAAFDAPAPAVPPPIDNRFVAPGCEQFGTRADAESLLTMLRATLDEYMRLAAAPVVREPQHTETSRLLANVADAARRLVEHADFQLGGILSADSKAKEIPSKAVSQVKARHLASLRDRMAELDAAHGIGGGGDGLR